MIKSFFPPVQALFSNDHFLVKFWLFLAFTVAGAMPVAANSIWQLDLEGPIGPASTDYIVRGLASAEQAGAQMVILRIDTPGGLDLAMREIIQAILASAVPVVGYVAPAGARAASAGTYILYACHYSAMAPATNLGAATPVQIASPVLPGITRKPQSHNPDPEQPASKQPPNQPVSPTGTAMQKKIINDAAAYIEGLARLRKRNVEWAIGAVRQGHSLSAEQALEKGVIEAIAQDIPQLIQMLDGVHVAVAQRDIVLTTRNAALVLHEPDWRSNFLATITNPNVAYILMMIGIYGLFFEFSNPGLGVPGVVGAMCLLLALYAFQVLPISYAGIALLLLGLALMIAEAVSPSFGVVGLGGIIAFVIGSVILMDTELPGYQIAMPVIGAFTAFSAILLVLVVRLTLRARQQVVVGGVEHLLNSIGTIEVLHDDQPMARFDGELWRVECAQTLAPLDRIIVTAIDGVRLRADKLQS